MAQDKEKVYDYVLETEEETTEESETESLDIAAEMKEFGFIQIRVCFHTAKSALIPLLDIPAISAQITAITMYLYPLFDISTSNHNVQNKSPSILLSIEVEVTSPSLEGWNYRKSIAIIGAADAGTLYQKKVIVHYGSGTDYNDNTKCPPERHIYCNSHCKTDFGDVRFTDNDKVSLLDYWLESKTNSDNAIFWVEVTDDLSSNQTIYIYYGKADAATTFNGDNTFPLYDHFDGIDINSAKWVKYSTGDTYGVANSILTLNHNHTYSWERIQSLTAFGINYAFRILTKQSDVSDYNKAAYLRWLSSTTGENPATYIEHYHNDYHNWFWRAYNTALESHDIGAANTAYHIFEICRASNSLAKCNRDNAFEMDLNVQASGGNKLVGMQIGNSGWDLYAFLLLVDWILVRKYVNPEPTYGAGGAEETYPF